MTVTIELPALLAERGGGEDVVELLAPTVGAALHVLAARYPDMAPLLWRGEGLLNPFLVAFLNEKDIDSLQGLDTHLRAGDAITLVHSLEGGK